MKTRTNSTLTVEWDGTGNDNRFQIDLYYCGSMCMEVSELLSLARFVDIVKWILDRYGVMGRAIYCEIISTEFYSITEFPYRSGNQSQHFRLIRVGTGRVEASC